ncbi:MAG: hypothetical protein APF80_14965 [Alphaproteobacteria bacterium BRH_c36]|nr:MAG: hypothetical protein APF80_14965 [Alphaproteobacteria bacterium BRH_c36]
MAISASTQAVSAREDDDVGGYISSQCCSDLEERIAELEQTTARKGNRKVDIEINGTINNAILFWDDQHERNAYVVNNDIDGNSFAIDGEVELEDRFEGWTVGFTLELDLLNAGSRDVDQLNDDGQTLVDLGEASIFIENERLGTMTLGFTSARGKTDGANESDLSGTYVASNVAVSDIGGSFFLRRSGAAAGTSLLALTWGDLIDPLDAPTGNIISYETPNFGGFSFSTYYGEDDIWNVGVGFNRDITNFTVQAGVGYSVNRDRGEQDLVDYEQVIGSLAVLHKPTGINFAIASGLRSFTETTRLNDGTLATPVDVSFLYMKAGLIRRLNALGNTAFYAEYGQFRDFQANAADTVTVAGLGGINEGNLCGGADVACLADGSDAEVWGVGLVQYVDAAEAQLYIGFRHHSADIDLVDRSGTRVPTVPLESFDTFIAGMMIEF